MQRRPRDGVRRPSEAKWLRSAQRHDPRRAAARRKARLLAGGQSLIATLNMPLSAPRLIVDIDELDELTSITLQGEPPRSPTSRSAMVSPTADSELGAKGAGTAGASGAVVNAINDALRPLGADAITSIPVTPDLVLAALGKI